MKVISVKAMAEVEGSYQELRELELKLTLTNKYKGWKLPLCEYINSNRMYIPRALVNTPVEEREWETYDIRLNSDVKLTQPQEELKKIFIRYTKEGKAGGIISAGTGTGKTLIGLALASHFKLKTLVIVPTERIFVQWISFIKNFTNLKVDDVGRVRGYKCVYEGKPIVVAMLQTICKDRFKQIEDKFGLVIFDEVHTISTKMFNTVAKKFWCKYRLGLSASPYRKDGMENVFFYHIGEIVSDYSKVNAKPKVFVVFYYNPATHHHGCFSYRGDFAIGRYYSRICANNHRNEVIAKYIRSAYNKNHDILILTERLKHIDVLMKLSKIPKEDCGKLTCFIKDINKKVIFGTYGSAGLGLDIPRLSCLILTTPRADVIQPVGRVLRAKERKPIIIDFVDESSNIMMAWYKKREQYYRKITDEIIILKEGIS